MKTPSLAASRPEDNSEGVFLILNEDKKTMM